jgi:hypothetical protein
VNHGIACLLATWLAAVMAGAAAPAIAAAAEQDSRCTEQAFADAAASRLGRVAPGARVHLLLDGDGCPGPDASCRSGAPPVPGQMLLLGTSRPGYVCVIAADGNGGNAGWLPQYSIAPATQPVDLTPPFAAWTGKWRYFDDRIVLTQTGGRLSASGEAYWPGKNVMPANEGEFAGTAAPSGNLLRITEEDPVNCAVDMVLAGPFLIVHDNQRCGGQNVSFSGIFVRRHAHER